MSIQVTYPVYRSAAIPGIEDDQEVQCKQAMGSYPTKQIGNLGNTGKMRRKRSFIRLSQSDRLFQ